MLLMIAWSIMLYSITGFRSYQENTPSDGIIIYGHSSAPF